MAGSTVDKLKAKLEGVLGYEVQPPVRTRAGKNQLEAFAWTWRTRPVEGGVIEIGSIFPMAHCVRAEALRVRKLTRTVGMLDVTIGKGT